MPPVSKFKRFDVRPLLRSGASPLSQVLTRAHALPAGEGLLIIAPFLPSPLVERLGAEGFASKLERGQGADWLVYFWRAGD